MLTPARERRLVQLLRDAAIAQNRGDLLTPPGDSAYDRLRAARAIAPRDARVQRATERLLPAAAACFERDLQRNRLARAGACLDAWQALGADRKVLRDARRRLALRWIAVGNERVGAGEFDAARLALATAQALEPGVPGARELDARLHAVQAARD